MNSITVTRWEKRKATIKITKKTEKQNKRNKKGGKKQKQKQKKTKTNHQNRSAIFIMVGFYYFDPGVGDLYNFDGFFKYDANITVNSKMDGKSKPSVRSCPTLKCGAALFLVGLFMSLQGLIFCSFAVRELEDC
jgi:hypothetical protein